MVIPMLWRISGYVVCMLVVKNQKLHIPPYNNWDGGQDKLQRSGFLVNSGAKKKRSQSFKQVVRCDTDTPNVFVVLG
jgi:hypothetical protein